MKKIIIFLITTFFCLVVISENMVYAEEPYNYQYSYEFDSNEIYPYVFLDNGGNDGTNPRRFLCNGVEYDVYYNDVSHTIYSTQPFEIVLFSYDRWADEEWAKHYMQISIVFDGVENEYFGFTCQVTNGVPYSNSLQHICNNYKSFFDYNELSNVQVVLSTMSVYDLDGNLIYQPDPSHDDFTVTHWEDDEYYKFQIHSNVNYWENAKYCICLMDENKSTQLYWYIGQERSKYVYKACSYDDFIRVYNGGVVPEKYGGLTSDEFMKRYLKELSAGFQNLCKDKYANVMGNNNIGSYIKNFKYNDNLSINDNFSNYQAILADLAQEEIHAFTGGHSLLPNGFPLKMNDFKFPVYIYCVDNSIYNTHEFNIADNGDTLCIIPFDDVTTQVNTHYYWTVCVMPYGTSILSYFYQFSTVGKGFNGQSPYYNYPDIFSDDYYNTPFDDEGNLVDDTGIISVMPERPTEWTDNMPGGYDWTTGQYVDSNSIGFGNSLNTIKQIGGQANGFIAGVSHICSFVPASIWALIASMITLLIILRVLGR